MMVSPEGSRNPYPTNYFFFVASRGYRLYWPCNGI